MYPNLLGMKTYYKLTNDEMARIIHVSRKSYETKMRTGKFTIAEAKAYCQYFNRDFDYLFAIPNTRNRTA